MRPLRRAACSVLALPAATPTVPVVVIADAPTLPAPAAALLDSLTTLRALVSVPGNAEAFAIDEDAACHERFLELRRLERSLDQYQSRAGQLTYVGWLGHFSAGKSSTINALLAGIEDADARATGQHPTDRAVTLITHPANAHSLIGMHRRGEVGVSTSLLENPLLEKVVLVDTPGSGDPLVVGEMVRDFLPICDQLVYVFSAAVPLDTADLPILRKAHSELPFVPMRYVITRADEFRIDHEAPLTGQNFDRRAADQFIDQFISRLEAAVAGLRARKEDFLLIDNRARFRLDALRDSVSSDAMKASAAASLHAHKLRYFANNAARIHDHFSRHLRGTLQAQEALLAAARANHGRYQKAVAMSHNRLTETWQLQRGRLADMRRARSEELAALAHAEALPEAVGELPLSRVAIETARNAARIAAREAADALATARETQLRHAFASARDALADAVRTARDPEAVAMTAGRAGGIPEAGQLAACLAPPEPLRQNLESLPATATAELKALTAETLSRVQQLSAQLEPEPLFSQAEAVLESSERQLAAMLDGFLESVQVYKAAVLAINARELAERAGAGRAIDALERVEIPESKRNAWLKDVTGRIFPERATRQACAADAAGRLRATVVAVRQSLQGNTFTDLPQVPSGVPDAPDDGAVDALRRVLGSADDAYQRQCNATFGTVTDAMNDAMTGHKATLLDTVARLRGERRSLRRALAGGGAIAGLILCILFSLVFPVFQPFTVFSLGMLAGFAAAAAYAALQVGERVGRFRAAIDACCAEYREHARRALLQALDAVECPPPSEALQAGDLAELLESHWSRQLEAVKAALEVQHGRGYTGLRAGRDQFEAARQEAAAIGDAFLAQLEACYANIDANIEGLATISEAIKEDAILPSFTLFEQRAAELASLLDTVGAIRFDPGGDTAAAPQPREPGSADLLTH